MEEKQTNRTYNISELTSPLFFLNQLELAWITDPLPSEALKETRRFSTLEKRFLELQQKKSNLF